MEEGGAPPAGTNTLLPLQISSIGTSQPHRARQALEGRHHLHRYFCEGFVYLAFILEVYSRKEEVGWSMATRLRTELVLDTLEMALWRRKPNAGLIHHTDRGAKYTALSFGKRLEEV